MTADEAIAIAKEHARDHGWTWLDPASARRRVPWFRSKGARWEILSHAAGLGPKVRVIVDEDTRAVIDSGYVPR